jgi:hypothetical protein
MIGLVLQYERIPATIITPPTGAWFATCRTDEFRTFEGFGVVGKAGRRKNDQEDSRHGAGMRSFRH